MINSIKNVYYVVDELPRAIKFHQEVLGLQLQFVDEGKWAQFKINGSTFALSSKAKGVINAGQGAVITFEVKQLTSIVAILNNNGISTGDIRDMGDHGITCYFRDPSGNPIQLYERIPADNNH